MMEHVRFHQYLWAVCAANGCRPADWGEARLLMRVLSALGRVPAFRDVFGGGSDPSRAAESWLCAFAGRRP